MRNDDRKAVTSVPVHDFIASRWSPCAFDDREVEPTDLIALFEAARWAPSCFNEQPWRFLVGRKGHGATWERVLTCLVEPNQVWAKYAPVLMLTLAATKFDRNGEPNRHAGHDVGLAMGNLALEATSRGLFVHQMAGIRPDHARVEFGLPEDVDVVAGVAIGYLGDPNRLPERVRDRDSAPRSRRALDTLVLGDWDETADFLSPG